ncbi:hypothetical protein [Aphanothece sacrum]|uniref:Uncharacterized protein n=1 Tax=Aphanothece sacrum FPU1 TaxID=1920663 RepID=A0A401IJU3_APHSA|nr:hypothetical protein [Aphanothece sacrum]GBF81486.1 hypothetical protein AsFPU1_2900 [Aphanothece sacrum FPU1]GBF85617.1 hypothetical protein AsFPU3_2680 [Aphanothece sacrum FPU3]
MTEEFKVTMLGHRGVGKTSILTAMYEQFDETFKDTNLQLTPDPESSALLQERVGQLKALLDDFEATGGLEGDENPRSFYFDLGKVGAKPSMKLVFQDFPGGYINNNPKFVENAMEECVAVLIAIDAPALMEAGGKWNDLMNRPKQICNFFQRSYGNLQEPKLVIFVPIRCEKYLQNDEDAKKLLRCIKSEYEQLFNFFKSEKLLTKIACVITPVQTVGTVFFSSIKPETIDGKVQPHFYFRKMSHDAGYTPKDSDQPLRYLLSFLLQLHHGKKWGKFNFIRQLFNLDKYLLESARKSAIKCKTSGGFDIVQGKDKLFMDK